MGMGRLTDATTLPSWVGRVLRAHRLAQGLTQSEVAARIGRKKEWICDLECRRNSGLTLARLELICGALGQRVSDVLREAEGMRCQVHPIETPKYAPTTEAEAAQ